MTWEEVKAGATRAWAWVRSHTWVVVLGLLGLVAVGLALAAGGTRLALLRSWVERMKAEKLGADAKAAQERAKDLSAQRARLLHEAREAAKARARLEEQDQDLEAEMAAREDEIRAMTAEEVAAEWNRLNRSE